MGERKFRIGLDIGIGSVGWAVISYTNREDARIEDFGSRIFVSGELNKGRERTSQERRSFRGVRRLERRRKWRKERLKEYFIKLGLLTRREIEEMGKAPCQDIFSLKVRALEEKVRPTELLQILLHSANHRGYRDFYEADSDVFSDADSLEDEKETRVNKKAAQDFDRDFAASGCRTISEYLWKHCRNDAGQVDFRNRSHRGVLRLIRRCHVEEETKKILAQQGRFYQELSASVREIIPSIIFAQRFFEDGPGNKNDPTRRYTGFLDKLGMCPFYPTERRGFRNTVLADIYAVTNALSQYRYQGKDGSSGLPSPAAREIVETTLRDGNMNLKVAKAILKKHQVYLFKSAYLDETALGKAIKFLRPMKRIAEKAGIAWTSLLGDNPLSMEDPPLLHQIGEVLAKYKTPRYRDDELKKLFTGTTIEGNQGFRKELAGTSFSGASACSYHYMHDAIEAFMAGEIYGDFQARRIKEENETSAPQRERYAQLPARLLEKDEDIRDNPVVYRAINEARRVVNAIVRLYGAPEYINVEVGRDLGRSFADRQRWKKQNDDNQKKRNKAVEAIARHLHCEADKVKPIQVERYRLYQEQDGKCLYSGEPIDLQEALNPSGAYEIDHIIPYSLILDNTLHNKVLVKWGENQRKGQRTPLMYMVGSQKAAFLERVNGIFNKKSSPWSKRKYEYLLQEALDTPEARQLVDAWKSRNINDMRYITKYVFNLFQRYLQFSEDGKGENAIHVHAIRGAITAKFRKTWLNPKTWGGQKDRKSHLHHAVDAVVLANLTPAYIEIASDNMRLQQIFRRYHQSESAEYTDYMERSVRKMKMYYGFSEEYTRSLLRYHDRVPSFVRRLREEVDIRFNDEDAERFAIQVKEFYGDSAHFLVPPHLPLTSHKAERRYRGEIAPANPIKVREIDGVPHKISRKSILSIEKKDLNTLYSHDRLLKDTLVQILDGKKENYTIENYLKEQGRAVFTLPNGTVVHKVSLLGNAISNFYRKQISAENYTVLVDLKYYCVEIYRDIKGKTRSRGIRYIDLVKKGKKLYLKEKEPPAGYEKHIMYLFAGDYIEAFDGKGVCYLRGTYYSVDSIKKQCFSFKCGNEEKSTVVKLKTKGVIKKYSVDLLGHKGGEIRCSVPLSSIPEND
ncbi:MAG: type II CRISPR RNA-guided endonuclease Cas9 [Schwartzia sp. (in: firmicutes)]